MAEPRFLSIDTSELSDGEYLVYDAVSHTIRGVFGAAGSGTGSGNGTTGTGGVFSTRPHAPTHAIGGTDALSPAAIGAANVNHNHDARYPLKTDVDGQIAAAVNALVDGAPVALETLKELADALSNDQNAVAALTTALANRATTAALSDEATARQNAVTTLQADIDAVSAKVQAASSRGAVVGELLVPDGARTDFPTLFAFAPNSSALYFNTQRLTRGDSFDYVEVGNQIVRLSFSPALGDLLVLDYHTS